MRGALTLSDLSPDMMLRIDQALVIILRRVDAPADPGDLERPRVGMPDNVEDSRYVRDGEMFVDNAAGSIL